MHRLRIIGFLRRKDRDKMEKLKEKKVLFVLGIILLILLVLFFLSKKEDYLNPVQQLQKEQSGISRSVLNALNKKLKKELEEKNLMEEELQYFYAYNKLNGEIYQGRFVDNYPITYQFELNINTKEVKVKEISKRKIYEEEQMEQEKGFDPNK